MDLERVILAPELLLQVNMLSATLLASWVVPEETSVALPFSSMDSNIRGRREVGVHMLLS